METIQPTLRIGRTVWDKINMPEVEFQKRIDKIKQEMKKEGIDVLLLYGHAFNDYGNPCYVSNFIIRLPRGTIVVVTQDGELELMFEGSSRGVPFAKTTTWLKDVRACGDISKEIVKYLKEKDFIPSTTGFAGLRQLMPYNQFQLLFKSLDQCKIVDVNHIIRDMRMVKSQRECDQIRRSSRIVSHTFDVISDTVFSNMNERILEAHIFKAARLEGAGDIRVLIAKPLKAKWALRPVEDTAISAGDSIIIYLAVEFERYWSERIRTFIVKDSSLVKPEFETAETLYKRIMKRIKPGKTVSQFYKEAIGEIEKSHAEYIPEYGLGHGIGLNLQEPPVIAEVDTNQLKEGMCFTLRLTIKDTTIGAAMVGNTINLSKKGPEILTN